MRISRRKWLRQGAVFVPAAFAILKANGQQIIQGSPLIPLNSSGQWTPQTPGTLYQWFTADQITSPPADNTVFSTWNKYLVGIDATAPSNPERPTYRDAAHGRNGLPMVTWPITGVDLKTAAFATPLARPFTVFFTNVFTDLNSAGFHPVFYSLSNTYRCTVYHQLSGGLMWASGATDRTAASCDTAWHAWMFEFDNAGTAYYRLDGGARTSMGGTSGTNPLDGLTLGNFFNTTTYSLYGSMGEFLIFSALLSAEDINSCMSYLKTRWGTP